MCDPSPLLTAFSPISHWYYLQHCESLCSAYTYVASVFQDLFIWYGRGSLESERKAAKSFVTELVKASDVSVAFTTKGRHGSSSSPSIAEHVASSLQLPHPIFQTTRAVDEMEEGSESDVFKDILGMRDDASAVLDDGSGHEEPGYASADVSRGSIHSLRRAGGQSSPLATVRTPMQLSLPYFLRLGSSLRCCADRRGRCSSPVLEVQTASRSKYGVTKRPDLCSGRG